MHPLLVKSAATAALATALVTVPQAFAAEGAPGARQLAAGCVACHGTQGKAQAGAKVLAGIDKTVFVAQMEGFKSGQQPATVMHQIAKGYGAAEIEMLAAYFAAQRR